MAGKATAAKIEQRAFDPLGELVRLQLEAQGLSQAELARRAKVRPVAIRQWLTGARGLRSDRVARCFEALGISCRGPAR